MSVRKAIPHIEFITDHAPIQQVIVLLIPDHSYTSIVILPRRKKQPTATSDSLIAERIRKSM